MSHTTIVDVVVVEDGSRAALTLTSAQCWSHLPLWNCFVCLIQRVLVHLFQSFMKSEPTGHIHNETRALSMNCCSTLVYVSCVLLLSFCGNARDQTFHGLINFLLQLSNQPVKICVKEHFNSNHDQEKNWDLHKILQQTRSNSTRVWSLWVGENIAGLLRSPPSGGSEERKRRNVRGSPGVWGGYESHGGSNTRSSFSNHLERSNPARSGKCLQGDR